MLDGPICELGPDHHVKKTRQSEKPCQPSQRRLTVDQGRVEIAPNPTLSQVQAYGYECEASEKNCWQHQEHDDSDVRVVDMSPNM